MLFRSNESSDIKQDKAAVDSKQRTYFREITLPEMITPGIVRHYVINEYYCNFTHYWKWPGPVIYNGINQTAVFRILPSK